MSERISFRRSATGTWGRSTIALWCEMLAFTSKFSKLFSPWNIGIALRKASVSLADLGAVAVATRPGLVGALVVGLTAAKALAMALDIPLIAVDHLECPLGATFEPSRRGIFRPGAPGRSSQLRQPEGQPAGGIFWEAC